MSTEHRRDPREPIAVKVRYIGRRPGACDYTDNVSRRGMFVFTKREWKIAQHVRFRLSFPRLLDPVQLEGIVRWKRAGAGDEHGYGIEFVTMDEETQADLEAFLARVHDLPE